MKKASKTKTAARTKAKPHGVSYRDGTDQPRQDVAVVEPAKVPARTKAKAAPIELGELEKILVQGDLSSLTEAQRLDYYKKVCATMGLNPLTKPFDYLKLDGKVVLYATRNCTDQLCATRKLSTQILSQVQQQELFVVRARAQDPSGRQSESLGAVASANLKGAALANAMMKAETKAKRRAVLSLCGLSMLDEEELEGVVHPSAEPEQQTLGSSTVTALEQKHVEQEQPKPETTLTTTSSLAGKVPAGFEQPSAGLSKELDRQGVQTGNPHRLAPGETIDNETGEIITPKQDAGPSGTKPKNRAGTDYPMPPTNVIAMLKDKRYIPWLAWIESPDFWKLPGMGPDAPEALLEDFKAAIKLIHKQRGPHWDRVCTVFNRVDIDLNEVIRTW